MLLREHTSRQRFGRVSLQNRHTRLPKDRAVIQLCCDLVNSTARLAVARVKGPLMGVQPLVFGQK